MAPTRHPEPEQAVQAALADYTQDVADAVAQHAQALARAGKRLESRVARIVQTYEDDRHKLSAIRELAELARG